MCVHCAHTVTFLPGDCDGWVGQAGQPSQYDVDPQLGQVGLKVVRWLQLEGSLDEIAVASAAAAAVLTVVIAAAAAVGGTAQE